MTKKQRLAKIISLIESEEISTQEELTAKLLSLGYNVSQSTVSRDINELNLIKAEGIGKKFKYIKADLEDRKVSPQIPPALQVKPQRATPDLSLRASAHPMRSQALTKGSAMPAGIRL